jgi:uncharacterized membrane protein
VSHQDSIADLAQSVTDDGPPAVRDIGFPDIMDSLTKGFADFKAHPSHVVLCIMIYPVVILVAAKIGAGYDILPLIWPLFSGVALISPLIAMGLYEMSRRREKGLSVSVKDGFRVLRSPSLPAILILSLVMIAIFLAWLIAALTIYDIIFSGQTAQSAEDFIAQLTTKNGVMLVIVGTAVGFVFALAVLCISVISFPLLLDRRVSAMTAAKTSLRAVLANPQSMAFWGLIIAVFLFLGFLPAFVGLAVVIPVLGHSTWHLYRKVVE